MKHTLILIFLAFSFSAFSQDFNKKKMDSLFSILAAKNKAMGSIAISKHGKLVYSNAIGYAVNNEQDKILATPKTKYRIGSITKMFTGVIIFQLVEEKKLSLETTLDKYYPTIPNAAKISIGNLLNHRSGLHNFTDDDKYMEYYQSPKTEKEMVAIMQANPSDFEPGTKTDYSNANFVLLGYIAEKITKKTYGQLVQERIISKLKLHDTYVGGKANAKMNESYSYNFINDWTQQPETDMSIPAAAGALVSTPADLVTFIEGLFAGKLVSASSLEKMKTIQDGLGMAMFKFPFYTKFAYGHNGGIDGFGSTLGYFPEDSVAFSYISNGQVYPMNDILIGILSIYFNKTYKIPEFKSITVSSTDLDKYLGVYASEQLPLKITVTKKGNSLMAQATGQPEFPLEAATPDVFKFEQAGVVMEFYPAKKEFVLKQGGAEYLFTRE